MEEKKKWYFSTSTLLIAFLCVGPFMLPLVWFNPQFSQQKKIVISAVIIILIFLMGFVLIASMKSIYKYYEPILQGL